MYKISFTILALVFLSCKDSIVDNQSQNNNKIIYETEYVNHAWGFTYQGTMIDQDGSIYSYNPAKDNASVLYHIDGYYTEQELQSKYQHTKTYLRKVDEDSLKWCHDLVTKVANDVYSDTTRVGVDMGSLEYSVYIYRSQNEKYQKIILRQEGDWAFYNKSENAKALVTWLKKLLSLP